MSPSPSPASADVASLISIGCNWQECFVRRGTSFSNILEYKLLLLFLAGMADSESDSDFEGLE